MQNPADPEARINQSVKTRGYRYSHHPKTRKYMQPPCCLFGSSQRPCQPVAAWQWRQSGSLCDGLKWPCNLPAARHVATHREQVGSCRCTQAVKKEQTGKLLLPAYPQPRSAMFPSLCWASKGSQHVLAALPHQEASPCCRRVMLKISGEALQGGMGFGVDPKVPDNDIRPLLPLRPALPVQ